MVQQFSVLRTQAAAELRLGTLSASAKTLLDQTLKKEIRKAALERDGTDVPMTFVAYSLGKLDVTCSAVSALDTTISFSGSPGLTTKHVYEGDLLKVGSYKYLIHEVQAAQVSIVAPAPVAHAAQSCEIYRRHIDVSAMSRVTDVRGFTGDVVSRDNMLTSLADTRGNMTDVDPPKMAVPAYDRAQGKDLIRLVPAADAVYRFSIQGSERHDAIASDSTNVELPDEAIDVVVSKTVEAFLKMTRTSNATAIASLDAEARQAANLNRRTGR